MANDHDTTTRQSAPAWHGILPRTLFARVTLILVIGLAVAQLLAFAAVQHERGTALRTLMLSSVERDIASSVAMLDRLPAAERPLWFDRLERPNYRFATGSVAEGEPPREGIMLRLSEAITQALAPYRIVRAVQSRQSPDELSIEVLLSDQSPLVIHAHRHDMPVSSWVGWLLLLQLGVLAACGWWAVRLVTRPLAELATVAESLGPDLKATPLDENGPTEVAHAAQAFNAMQLRIAAYMNERVEILAAISHDLQTPITRMKLRTDLMDDSAERQKLRQDLDAMQSLVKQGIAYARTLHGAEEPALRLDLDSLVSALIDDYQDVGQPVTLQGEVMQAVYTRPHALRRILTNLIDNAIKFGGEAEVHMVLVNGTARITVADRGPGIPEDQLDAVLRPFHRIETSRNRSTGGTGLGLAIAHQLAQALGATLALSNRPDGGLQAQLDLPLG